MKLTTKNLGAILSKIATFKECKPTKSKYDFSKPINQTKPLKWLRTKSHNQNFYMNTLLDEKISDPILRDLLRRSRKNNSVRPVHYKGKTYWNLDDLTAEQNQKTWRKALIFFGTATIGSMIFLMTAFYLFAYFFIPEMVQPT